MTNGSPLDKSMAQGDRAVALTGLATQLAERWQERAEKAERVNAALLEALEHAEQVLLEHAPYGDVVPIRAAIAQAKGVQS